MGSLGEVWRGEGEETEETWRRDVMDPRINDLHHDAVSFSLSDMPPYSPRTYASYITRVGSRRPIDNQLSAKR